MSEIIKRILTGSALAALTLFLIFKSPIGFTVLIAAGVLVVGYEFAKLSQMKLLLALTVISLAFFTPSFLAAAAIDTDATLLLIFYMLQIVFWLKNLFLVVKYPQKKPSNNEFNKVINLFLLLSPLTFLVMMTHNNTHLLLLLLLVVWGADSFAYFSGKSFGKRKLAPNLSGGKTIEGVIGGLVGVLIITSVWMVYYSETNWKFLLLVLVTGIFSVVGDLYESIYKREAGVKDSGNILPGHGGMFDRLDGLLAATPIFTIGLMFL